jgi:hypothetical protein
MITVLISMHDEEATVNATVKEILRIKKDAFIYVVQSKHKTVGLPENVDCEILPNLAGTVKRYELAARSLSRNLSLCFKKAFKESEYIVAITGDTLVTDATNFDRRVEEMTRNKMVLACSQAIGQNFHAVDSDPENGRCGGRFQFYGISDFMPQFFIVDGEFFRKTGAFTDIAITNPFTTEQCLGDEFVKHAKGDFRKNALVFSDNAYQYSDGIKYHIRGL